MKQSLNKINRIAAANASRAIKKMFGKAVELKIPLSKVENIRRLKPFLDPERMIVGVYLPIGGEVKGAALFVIPRETAFILSDILLKRRPGFARKLTRLDRSALKEVGNIICGQYFTVFSNMLGLKIIENIPNLSCSMFGAIMSDIFTRFSRFGDEALIIEVNMVFKPKVLKAHFLILFEPVKVMSLLK